MGQPKGSTGNPNGGPGIGRAKSAELRAAISKIEKQMSRAYNGAPESFFEHVVLQAYSDNTLAAAIVRKLVPDLKSVDVKTTQDSPFRLIIDVTPQGKTDKQKKKPRKK